MSSFWRLCKPNLTMQAVGYLPAKWRSVPSPRGHSLSLPLASPISRRLLTGHGAWGSGRLRPEWVVRRSGLERQLPPELAIRSAQSGMAATRLNAGRLLSHQLAPKAAICSGEADGLVVGDQPVRFEASIRLPAAQFNNWHRSPPGRERSATDRPQPGAAGSPLHSPPNAKHR